MNGSKYFTVALLFICCLTPYVAYSQSNHHSFSSTFDTLGGVDEASFGNKIILVVDTGFVLPPASTTGVTKNDRSIESIASGMGVKAMRFGNVYSFAMPSITALNTDPKLIDLPDEDLAALQPANYLLLSLNPKQFDLLATTGIGRTDLTPAQQAVFQELLPNPFEIIPTQSSGDSGKQVLARNDVLNNVRLHAFLSVSYSLDSPTGTFEEYNDPSSAQVSTGAMKLSKDTIGTDYWRAGANALEERLVAASPNVPKPSDLDWDDPSLQSRVQLGSKFTVSELVSLLAKATGLELYADVRYGDEDCYAVGNRKTSFAVGDLMRALALDVGGAWRKVGPAYVLTNDIAGYASRQQIQKDIVAIWAQRYSKAVILDCGQRLKDLAWMQKLTFIPGGTSDIPKELLEQVCGNGDRSFGTTTWKNLSPVLQSSLSSQIISDAENPIFSLGDMSADKAIVKAINPETAVTVNASITLAFEMPQTGIMKYQDVAVATHLDKPVILPRWNAKATFTDRPSGILCVARTPDEARADVDAMPGLGLNALYLDVFNNGHTYFHTSAFGQSINESAGVLDAAIAEGVSRHIQVYAVADTFCWSKDGQPISVPGYAEDIGVSGFGASADFNRRENIGVVSHHTPLAKALMDDGPARDGWVSPLDPAVAKPLPKLIGDLAAAKGLSGIILQDTSPPGYGGYGSPYIFATGQPGTQLGLGYSVENRLAFLRAYHVDPIDLSGNTVTPINTVNSQWTSAPFFSDVTNFDSSQVASQLANWTKIRVNADRSILRNCFDAAKASNPNISLYMRERLYGMTIDPWIGDDNVDQIPTAGFNDDQFSEVDHNTILAVPAVALLNTEPDSLTYEIGDERQTYGNTRSGGLLLDLSTGADPKDVALYIQKLGQYIGPSK